MQKQTALSSSGERKNMFGQVTKSLQAISVVEWLNREWVNASEQLPVIVPHIYAPKIFFLLLFN